MGKTKKIIEEFDTLVGAIMGETVVIDEIDNGIHDLLMKNIKIKWTKMYSLFIFVLIRYILSFFGVSLWKIL